MPKYEVIDLYDVWGNAEEGYWVNDQTREGIYEINDESEIDIIRSMREHGFFSNIASSENTEVLYLGGSIELQAFDGYPFYELIYQEEE